MKRLECLVCSVLQLGHFAPAKVQSPARWRRGSGNTAMSLEIWQTGRYDRLNTRTGDGIGVPMRCPMTLPVKSGNGMLSEEAAVIARLLNA